VELDPSGGSGLIRPVTSRHPKATRTQPRPKPHAAAREPSRHPRPPLSPPQRTFARACRLTSYKPRSDPTTSSSTRTSTSSAPSRRAGLAGRAGAAKRCLTLVTKNTGGDAGE
jgi:hypothetical protein